MPVPTILAKTIKIDDNPQKISLKIAIRKESQTKALKVSYRYKKFLCSKRYIYKKAGKQYTFFYYNINILYKNKAKRPKFNIYVIINID